MQVVEDISSAQARRTREASIYAREAGLSAPQLLRETSGTSIFHCGDRVIRVSVPQRSAMTADRLPKASRLLISHGVSAARSLAPASRTLSGDDITIWEYVPTDASHPFPAFEVGRQLSLLHAIPLAVAAKALGGPVPSLDAAALRGRVRALELDSMAETGLLAGFHKGELVSLFDGVYSGFQSALAASEPVLLHGDMNEGNVLWGVNPLPVLCDFEAMTRGPWAWDMVNMIVSVARGQSDPSLMALLVQGYGADPSFCPGWSDLCQMRAFNIVTWHMLAAYESGIMNEEAFSLASWLTEGFPGLP